MDAAFSSGFDALGALLLSLAWLLVLGLVLALVLSHALATRA